jgi:electron transport complex protein RnfB
MAVIIVPVVILAGIGLVMATLLAFGRKAFAVEVDERQELLMDILPGANCGGCGFPGCSGYASALVGSAAPPTACPPGGSELAHDIGKIMGVEVGDVPDIVAVVACAGDDSYAPERASYLGVQTCGGAESVAGGLKQCTHGCLGLGSCEEACPFDAIVITDKHLAVVIPELCTGCGNCVDACPRNIIKLVPKAEQVHVLCHNPDKSKQVKAVCSVGCTGCKICAKHSKRLVIDGALAAVDTSVEEDIAEHTALSCPQGSIYDSRIASIDSWLNDPAVREAHEKRSEEWKAEEKKKKAAARAAKAAKKEAAAKKEETVAGEGGAK